MPRTTLSDTKPRANRGQMKNTRAGHGALRQIGEAFGEPAFADDEVAREAYSLYCERGHVDGHDVDDWFEAERRVKARHAASTPQRPATVN